MAGNNNTKNDSTQKIVTKYDKKMAKERLNKENRKEKALYLRL